MEKKKIVLISRNDLLGGAAVVTYRLMKALQELGHDAQMLVFKKIGNDPDVHQLGAGMVRSARFLKERLGIFFSNGFNRRDLFKVSTATTGMNIHRHPLVKGADAIFVNWVNQATVSLKEMRRLCSLGKPVIWTMHDMWCMTGICHLPFGCEHYKNECGNCPFLGWGAGANDLSRRVLKRKKQLYASTDIQFVAVSSWVKQRAAESNLLADKNIAVIHNAFPAHRFTTNCNDDTPPVVPPGKYKHIIVFGAAKLDDKVKGVEYAIQALNILKEESPELAAESVALFFGEVVNPQLFADLQFPHITYGSITNHAELHRLYTQTNVVLSTSRFEMLPGTLIEGMSCGATPVTFGVGGQTDIVDHKLTGYVARYLDARDVAEGLRWALTANLDRDMLHNEIVKRFDAHHIARSYLALLDK